MPNETDDERAARHAGLRPLPEPWGWRRGIDYAWEAHTSTGDIIVQEATDRSLTPTDGRLRIAIIPGRPDSGHIDAEGNALVPSIVLLAVARANGHEGIP